MINIEKLIERLEEQYADDEEIMSAIRDAIKINQEEREGQ